VDSGDQGAPGHRSEAEWRDVLARALPLPLVGDNLEAPLVTGESRRYVNLDFAASTPALLGVRDAVEEFLPWYSSVHRGAGFKSMVSTAAYEGARRSVHSFLNARSDDVVVFTRNTTDSMNLLASALPEGCLVVTFETEHHANFLPWMRHDVSYLPTPPTPESAVASLTEFLDATRGGRPRLVAVTGASNVTGEIWPIAHLAGAAHRHGASIVVDAAQLAPHHRIDMTELDVDYLAMSGHKLYAPYGAGVLVGRRDWIGEGEPFLAGGGAVDFVGTEEVLWTTLPDRQEAGSPNVVGAVALGTACRILEGIGMDAVAAREAEVMSLAEGRLAKVGGFRRYGLWGSGHPRIGVLTFNLGEMHYAEAAAVLSAEYGIGVRHGCFCAHPLMLHLLEVAPACADEIRAELREGGSPSIPGAVRASFGIGTTDDDVERFVDAVERLVVDGPQWTYERVGGVGCVPVPDPRPLPGLAAELLAVPQ
jgi:selenocysteine lyase/cysteine desulfurase